MSVTLAALLFAVAARRSATRTASVPFRAKVLSAAAMRFAASFALVSPAAASWREPRAAFMLSLTERPARASSVIASAASAALAPGIVMSLPSCFAVAETSSIWLLVELVTAWNVFRLSR